jgi:hypothetical protein
MDRLRNLIPIEVVVFLTINVLVATTAYFAVILWATF